MKLTNDFLIKSLNNQVLNRINYLAKTKFDSSIIFSGILFSNSQIISIGLLPL